MTIEAEIVADSINAQGNRLTTFKLRYPRFIHAEFMTHRDFSRNASSSRAIPVKRMIEDLRRDPAMPTYWGSNKPGMQAGEELGHLNRQNCEVEWRQAMEICIAHAEEMMEYGLHKQIANRILEPWAHINVVVTATNYTNFFNLRCHPDAQPEIKVLADLMRKRMGESKPALLGAGQWHLPFIQPADWLDRGIAPGTPYQANPELVNALRRISVARCARVSYLTHAGKQATEIEDLLLYDRLLTSEPLHASPAEHQATPDYKISATKWLNTSLHGNLKGWMQFRKMLPQEYAEKLNDWDADILARED